MLGVGRGVWGRSLCEREGRTGEQVSRSKSRCSRRLALMRQVSEAFPGFGLAGYGGSSYIDSVILRDRDNWDSESRVVRSEAIDASLRDERVHYAPPAGDRSRPSQHAGPFGLCALLSVLTSPDVCHNGGHSQVGHEAGNMTGSMSTMIWAWVSAGIPEVQCNARVDHLAGGE